MIANNLSVSKYSWKIVHLKKIVFWHTNYFFYLPLNSQGKLYFLICPWTQKASYLFLFTPELKRQTIFLLTPELKRQTIFFYLPLKSKGKLFFFTYPWNQKANYFVLFTPEIKRKTIILIHLSTQRAWSLVRNGARNMLIKFQDNPRL